MTNKSQKTKNKISKNKIVLTIVCVFIALVLIFGVTFGIILCVRNAKTVVSYAGVRLEEGEVNFLKACYKYSFIVNYAEDGAKDTLAFWNSKHDENRTYGELLREGAEEYIKETVVKVYLFDRFCSLSTLDEDSVNLAIKDVLRYRADGSEEKFNETYSDFGFDFDDFSNMCYVLYKAAVVGDLIYGANGENMQSLTAECNKYFENYSHVKLLFIRTENDFVLDSNGNRIIDRETGEEVLVDFTDSEKARVQALLSEIRASIKAFEDKTDDLRMTPEYFNRLLSEHGSDDSDKESSGYYFSAYSSYTQAFVSDDDGVNEQRLEIVKRALSMKEGSYAELPYSGGVCFIYKYGNTAGAYTDTSADGFFSDFYYLAAEQTFMDFVTELLSEVKIKDKYSNIDVVSMPSENMFIPRF